MIGPVWKGKNEALRFFLKEKFGGRIFGGFSFNATDIY